MRVTQNTNFDTVKSTIHKVKDRMAGLQEQAATMKKLNQPSDNPTAAAKVLEIRTDKVNNSQFMENAKLAEASLQQTDHALEDLSNIMIRAKEIALSQASGASSNDNTRLGISEEVTHLFKSAVAAGNSRIGDRFVFGGYKTHQMPISQEGLYQGDDGEIMAEIGRDVFISTNVNGLEAFNTRAQDSADMRRMAVSRNPAQNMKELQEKSEISENVNAFSELQNLRIALLSGDLEGIRNTLDRFDQLISHLNSMRAKVGSRIQGLGNSTGILEKREVTNAQLNQDLEDADMAEVMSNLAKEEIVLESAMKSTKRLIQPTLMDFLG